MTLGAKAGAYQQGSDFPNISLFTTFLLLSLMKQVLPFDDEKFIQDFIVITLCIQYLYVVIVIFLSSRTGAVLYLVIQISLLPVVVIFEKSFVSNIFSNVVFSSASYFVCLLYYNVFCCKTLFPISHLVHLCFHSNLHTLMSVLFNDVFPKATSQKR